MTEHVFVDETKQRGFVLAACVVPDGELRQFRKELRGLLLVGQRRLHMAKEGPTRRAVIVGTIVDLGVRTTIYEATSRDEREARASCLRALIHDMATAGQRSLVLERDDSVIRADQQTLYSAVRSAGCADQFRYEQLRAAEEPLLSLPDAIAWCWARRQEWRTRVRPLIEHVRSVNMSG